MISVIADYVGHVNIVIIYIIISGISCLLLWVYANTFGMLMAFATVFGFFGGAFITLSKSIIINDEGLFAHLYFCSSNNHITSYRPRKV